MKKASGKSKGKTRKPAKKKPSRRSKKPVDLVEVRKDITEIVGSEATELTKAVVGEGLKGQLAPVKYLFEMTGLYPAMGESQAKPEEASLAKTLLHRLGLPTDPVIAPEDEPRRKLTAGESANEADEEESESSDSPPEKQNSQAGEKDADKDDDVPVPAE